MKKLFIPFLILVAFIFSMNYVFAQSQIVGNWNFGLVEKINPSKLVVRANELGGQIKEEDSIFVFAITAIYVINRCENSEMIVSDFENTVLIIIKSRYDPTLIHKLWGKWTYIGNKLYHIVMESGDEEVYEYNEYNELDNTIILADSKYQSKIITKLLANNLMLIKKEE